MKRWRGQRGDVPVGCLIGFVLLVLITIIAMNVIPAQVKLGELEKRIDDLANRSNRRDYTNERIKIEILDKAEELDLAIGEDDVVVERNDRRIKIRVIFDQEIRFPGYTWVRHHDYLFDRPVF